MVLTRRGMRSSTNAYLTALAIADLVYLLCVFWLSLRHYPHVKEDVSLSNFYAYTWPYSLWLTDATSKYDAYLILPYLITEHWPSQWELAEWYRRNLANYLECDL